MKKEKNFFASFAAQTENLQAQYEKCLAKVGKKLNL
jgi:hypothetical protein